MRSADRPMRIVLVTHETTRSGAPRIALLVAGVLTRDGHRVQVVARSPGPLLGEFEGTTNTSLEPFRRLRAALWRTFPRQAAVIDTGLAALTLLKARADLVYVNSTSAGVYVRAAAWLRRPAVLHAHESGKTAEAFLPRAGIVHDQSRATVVACSPSVRAELAPLLGCPEDEILLVPSVPDTVGVARRAAEPPDRPYRADELVVGCCGRVERRKGTDLWLAVAERVLAQTQGRRVRFVWVGDTDRGVPATAVQGIDFTGSTQNPYPHLRRFDVATLPSRDDPFPLVVLEAMLLATPVVAFAVGGVPHQLGDTGVLVKAGDVDGMAAAVLRLLNDQEERARLGARGAERVRTTYSTETFNEGVRLAVASALGSPAEPTSVPRGVRSRSS